MLMSTCSDCIRPTMTVRNQKTTVYVQAQKHEP